MTGYVIIGVFVNLNLHVYIMVNSNVLVTEFYFLSESASIHRKNFKSCENQAVLSKLMSEVKGLNPSFGAADIRGTCRLHCSILYTDLHGE